MHTRCSRPSNQLVNHLKTWTVETCPDAASQETFETPAVVGGGKAPPGTGSVGQPGDDDSPVCCLQRGVA